MPTARQTNKVAEQRRLDKHMPGALGSVLTDRPAHVLPQEHGASDGGILYGWAEHRVVFYLEALQRHLPRVAEGGRRVTPCSVCCSAPSARHVDVVPHLTLIAWPLWTRTGHKVARRAAPSVCTYASRLGFALAL